MGDKSSRQGPADALDGSSLTKIRDSSCQALGLFEAL